MVVLCVKVAKKPRKRKKREKARVAKEEEPETRGMYYYITEIKPHRRSKSAMTLFVLDSDQESEDEVDVAVREVNKLLGEVGKERGGEREEGEGEGEETESSPVPHSLLKVDRRCSTYTWGQCVMGKRRNSCQLI